MKTEERPEAEECSLGAGPFVFSGKPPLVEGTVRLINRSAEKAKVRSVTIDSAELSSFRAVGLSEEQGEAPEAIQQRLPEVRVFGRLGPYEQESLPAQLSIDRFTPPGEYEAQVSFGDQQVRALIFVLENHDLRLAPDRISITTAPGESITKCIYVTNEGNVPFSTRRAAFAPLQALNMLHRSLAIALNEDGHKGHQKVLDRLASELADAEVQPAKVKIDIQDQEILPGETKRVELTIQLPADLKRKRTYTSRISFRNARLAVEVEVNDTYNKTNGRAQ